MRYGLFALWVAIAAGALYLYFFKREAVQSELRDALSASFWIASISYLLIGALRAFTWCRRRSRCWLPCRFSTRGSCWP